MKKEEKKELRNAVKATVSALPAGERELKSVKAAENLLALEEFRNAKTVGIYLAKDDEVDTIPLIRKILGKKILTVPVIEDRHGRETMRFARLESLEGLVEARYGVLEPRKKLWEKDEMDVIVVPGVVFDRKGNRLGRGKGFYDRFLGSAQSLKIGLAFQEQVADEVPVEAHDIKMDIVVTDKGVL